jgi:hypothetical protein
VRPWTNRFFCLDPVTKSLQYYTRWVREWVSEGVWMCIWMMEWWSDGVRSVWYINTAKEQLLWVMSGSVILYPSDCQCCLLTCLLCCYQW